MEKWKKHMQEIFDDVSQMVENRHVFYKLRNLLEPNIVIAYNIFFDHYVVNYVSSITSSVRRQIDTKTEHGGLMKLLENIEKKPEIITREFFLKPFAPLLIKEGGRIWKEKYGGDDYLSKKVIRLDIFRLKEVTKKLKNFVDKRVAHKDKHDEKYDMNYSQLDSCVDILEELTIKYYSLIVSTGSGIPSLLATNIDGWEKIFYEPWIKKPR